MHGPNRTHNMKYCFKLKQCTKRTKADASCGGADKVSYKDLNAFADTKVTPALNKAEKNQKKKEAKKVTINTFDNFRNLKVDNSSNEESNHEVNGLAATSDNDSDSNASRVPSDDSNSNSKLMAGHDLAANNGNNNSKLEHVINYCFFFLKQK